MVLVTGECYRDSPSKWFSLSTFIKHSFEGTSETNMETTAMYKWTLLKFVSVYRSPLTIYLRAHVSLHIQELEGVLEKSGAKDKEELSTILKEVKKANSLGFKGMSRTQMMNDLQEEWDQIKNSDPQIQSA